ncbi:MAG: DUF1015 domain-containing protein [Flavobacteriales bacterium]|nr:DUF1015 domain-containing protein [Flavobacteriales bacterium]
MARVRPFKAFRPTPNKVHLVASRSYVTYSEWQLRDKLENNPFTFIHIINPDYNEEQPSEPASQERFQKVRQRYEEFIDEEFFVQDDQPSYYIYRQSKHDLDCIGVISVVHADDYRNGTIKIHEPTLSAREELFANYLDATSFNAEPTLMSHEDLPEVNAFYQEVMQRPCEYDYMTTDRVEHQFWLIDDPKEVTFLTDAFSRIESLYIADGHHRSASAVLLAERRRAQASTEDELGSDYFMSYMIPASALVIHGYHRLVRDLNGLQPEEFVSAISALTKVTPLEEKEQLPKVGTIDMYVHERWYRLDFSDQIDLSTPDSAWLTSHIFKPILGIGDLRSDSRIAFEPETSGIETLASMVDDGRFACAFILHPVPFDQLKMVSDLNQCMPPKSTWIEPKLRSGLTIYDFSDQNS